MKGHGRFSTTIWPKAKILVSKAACFRSTGPGEPRVLMSDNNYDIPAHPRGWNIVDVFTGNDAGGESTVTITFKAIVRGMLPHTRTILVTVYGFEYAKRQGYCPVK